MATHALATWHRFLVQNIPTLVGNRSRCFPILACLLLMLITPWTHAAKVEDFMPKESILYLKFQDIDEVYNEIEVSEQWEQALAPLSDMSDFKELQQGLSMVQGLLGTDLQEIMGAVGYRTALAVWFDEAQAGLIQLGVVIHSGGNLDRLRQLTKILEGLIGMSEGNTLRVNAGVYQRVQYNALEMDAELLKYGFVGDFFVLGVGEGSFEKLLDTYRTDIPDIQENEEFNTALKKIGPGEVTVFVHIDYILLVLSGSDVWLESRLPVFPLIFGHLNLLDTAPLLQIAVQFKPDAARADEIGMFLEEGAKLETLNAISGDEDLFIAVAPHILEGGWELARTQMAAHPDADIDAFIAFVEGLLNLDLEEDIIAGLTGELALSVPDLTQFDPNTLQNFRTQFDGTFELDAGDVETSGGIIFNPMHRMKWNQIGNSLTNLQNASVSQTDYKGTTVSGFASNIYYGEIEGLFLLGFSQEQVGTLIDGIQQKRKPPYLKQLPKTPAAFAQLNVARAIEMENGTPPADRLLVEAKAVPLLLAWFSVEDDIARLTVTLSEQETPIEMVAKLVPFLLQPFSP